MTTMIAANRQFSQPHKMFVVWLRWSCWSMSLMIPRQSFTVFPMRRLSWHGGFQLWLVQYILRYFLYKLVWLELQCLLRDLQKRAWKYRKMHSFQDLVHTLVTFLESRLVVCALQSIRVLVLAHSLVVHCCSWKLDVSMYSPPPWFYCCYRL